MSLRLSREVTDVEVRRYVYATDGSPIQADGQTLIWVYQFILNQAGVWSTVFKTFKVEEALSEWKNVRERHPAVRIDRRLAYVHDGKAYLINLVPWQTVKVKLSNSDEEGYVHLLGQTAI